MECKFEFVNVKSCGEFQGLINPPYDCEKNVYSCFDFLEVASFSDLALSSCSRDPSEPCTSGLEELH